MVGPYGSWKSPITSSLIVESGVSLSDVRLSGGDVYWLEGRPREKGRYVVCRRRGGVVTDVTPEGFSARTRVHEYGGGAYTVFGSTVFFSNWSDQRLYRQDDGAEPAPITPEPASPSAARYADGRVTPDGRWLICVRELHGEGPEARNEIVAVPTDGAADPTMLWSGPDFVSFPRISPDGHRLAWTSWDHPRMPWDGTKLWVADLMAGPALGPERPVAGGAEESIFQPEWGPDGDLWYVSDRSGWWNLYSDAQGGEAVVARESEFGLPQWVFGLSTYAVLADGRILCSYSEGGVGRLAFVDRRSREVVPIDFPYTSVGYVCSDGERVALVAASPSRAPAVLTFTSPDDVEVVRRGLEIDVDPAYLSAPEPIEFPTSGGLTAHGLYYRPANRDFVGPMDENPPLLVKSHGGPTSAASSALNLGIQYWTSRGIAVVDVNYGGSTGYGRPYRQRLQGQWGIVDVDDCVNAARHLVERGEVDGRRLAITGGSAGGYTTLCALVFRDLFAAGASHYGVADAEALATDTHKFESRYLDGLIGPYPEARDVYHERSPIHFADRLSCPLILFQGTEDEIVPLSQAERLVEALRKKGLPFAYLPFEGEQHGFRQAANVKRALDAELYFYSRVFGFALADPVEPVEIENL